MPTLYTPFDDTPVVAAKIRLDGVVQDVDLIVDTGFSLTTRAGLKLDISRLRLVGNVGSTYITLADGREVAAGYAPSVEILSLEGQQLVPSVKIPTLFLEGIEALGVMFLLKCSTVLDGTRRMMTIQLP